jgi:hypothetical protein
MYVKVHVKNYNFTYSIKLMLETQQIQNVTRIFNKEAI